MVRGGGGGGAACEFMLVILISFLVRESYGTNVAVCLLRLLPPQMILSNKEERNANRLNLKKNNEWVKGIATNNRRGERFCSRKRSWCWDKCGAAKKDWGGPWSNKPRGILLPTQTLMQKANFPDPVNQSTSKPNSTLSLL